jgi:hypothetical protein
VKYGVDVTLGQEIQFVGKLSNTLKDLIRAIDILFYLLFTPLLERCILDILLQNICDANIHIASLYV